MKKLLGSIYGKRGRCHFEKEFAKSKLDKTKMAASVGKSLAEKAVKIGIKNVSFDRSGYLYHGRVKSLADGAREGGLKF